MNTRTDSSATAITINTEESKEVINITNSNTNITNITNTEESTTNTSISPLRIDAFKVWYKAYPRKIARKGAEKAWKAAEKAKELPPLDELLAILEKQKASRSWQQENGRYIPYPGTYLNGRRFEDEIEDETPDENPYNNINWGTTK